MEIDSDGLADYVRAVLRGINSGVTTDDEAGENDSEVFALSGPVKFHVSLTNISEKKGEVKLFVQGLGGGYAKGASNQEHATVDFEVTDSAATFYRNIENLQTIYGKLSESQRKYVDDILAKAGKAISDFVQSLNYGSVKPA
ncbi:MAG TPA: hypothetical protein VFE91_05215 [Nitrososphaerales archaeon]|nr:hypothetical protein [Nitrososphaerales archaeon]